MCEEIGMDHLPRICIFSGVLAGRGISYVSSKMRDGKGWHVNGLRIARSNSMNNATLLQAAGRLLGNFNDSVPLKLYSDRNTCNAIWNSYLQQANLLPKANNEAKIQNTSLKDSFFSLPVSHKQRGDRNLSTSVKRYHFRNIVADEQADTWNDINIKTNFIHDI